MTEKLNGHPYRDAAPLEENVLCSCKSHGEPRGNLEQALTKIGTQALREQVDRTQKQLEETSASVIDLHERLRERRDVKAVAQFFLIVWVLWIIGKFLS